MKLVILNHKGRETLAIVNNTKYLDKLNSTELSGSDTEAYFSKHSKLRQDFIDLMTEFQLEAMNAIKRNESKIILPGGLN